MKRRAMLKINVSRKLNTDSAYYSVSYDLVVARLLESGSEIELSNIPITMLDSRPFDWFLLSLLLWTLKL